MDKYYEWMNDAENVFNVSPSRDDFVIHSLIPNYNLISFYLFFIKRIKMKCLIFSRPPSLGRSIPDSPYHR